MAEEIIKYRLPVCAEKLGLVALFERIPASYIFHDKLTDLERFIHRILTENEQMQKALEKAGLNAEVSTPESPDIQPEEKSKADDWVVPFDLLKERVRICENKIEDIFRQVVTCESHIENIYERLPKNK